MITRRFIFSILLATLALLFLFSGAAARTAPTIPKAENGTLDLRNWKFSNDGSIKLDGEWSFFWQRLYSPLDFIGPSPPQPVGVQKVPGLWNDRLENGTPLSGSGYATYRLKVLLNPNCCLLRATASNPANNQSGLAFQAMGLRFMFVETAFTVFINGEKVTSAGTVGISSQTSKPQYLPQTPSFLLKGNELDIVIQVSNFHHRKGGLESTILLGCQRDIQKSRQQSLFIDIFLFSSIIIMGFYYLGIFLLWKKERAPLYFSLLCFLVATRAIVVGDYFILTIFPQIPWEILLKIEYISILLPITLFSLFLISIYPQEINQTATRVFTGITLCLSLFVLVTPVLIFSWILNPFQVLVLGWGIYLLIVLIMTVKRKREGAVFLLFGGFALFITGLNDILYNNLLIGTGMLFPLGMFIFILFQAFVLARRTSSAFFSVELLSENLEIQVIQRTRELSAKNNQMKQLLHVLCHDLQNPLANIQSIITASVKDPELFKQMIPHAASSVNNGMATIELIREIQILEAKQISLPLDSFNLLKLVEDSEQMLSQRLKQKSLTFEKEVDGTLQVRVERTSFVNSVLNNILTNAIKFSGGGSTIRVEGHQTNGNVVLSIVDKGIGIPPSLLADLFNLEKSTSRAGTEGETGTGFGMPLVKTFIEAYGGRIEVFSREALEGSDHGTEIRLILKSG